jgi:biotin carboxyl carrier protein
MAELEKNMVAIVEETEFHFAVRDIENADVIQTADKCFHIIHNGRSVIARLIESDDHGKKVKIEINGRFHHVQVRDELLQMLDKMGFNNPSAKQLKEIKAPMPGMVIDVSVEDGQVVEEGERLIILEAMKMENSITIPTAATIRKVLVKKGQAVEKNQVMIELE